MTSIGDEAFSGCSSLTSVAIPNSVTSIGNDAFSGTAWYNNQSDGLVYAGKVAYKYKGTMPANTSIFLLEGTLGIASNAFSGCSSLTSVTIPNSVTSIGSSAFQGCYNLRTIYSQNPTPPLMGSRVFICSTTDVRDAYDIYSYVYLHVPMGSGEAYSSAREWRYFNRIKEDMDINGEVYFVNFTVKQGTTGYTRSTVKADEKQTLYIGSLGENKVNAVTFNGKDVTDEVRNGYYTTPEMKGESVLSITYESGTAVRSLEQDHLKVLGCQDEISIKGIDHPCDVYVYTADGKLVSHVPSAQGDVSLRLSPEQLYIVKVGSRAFKVAL